MIGYTTLGTNDLERAGKFYDALFSVCFRATRDMEGDRFIAWGTPDCPGQFAVTKPFNNGPATVSNGGMISLMLNSREEVDQFYAHAMDIGASCEGAPGPREIEAFYASYFRDLDGNKIGAFFYDKANA